MTINSLDEHNICTRNIIAILSHSNDNDKLINGFVVAKNKLFQLIPAFIYTYTIARMYLL